ncbi:MAG: hypothetical protein MJA32_05915 [Proteobacteria bacterium]|nr:hypothetical protein [Pseudomonadota bacterium]
MKKLRVMVLAPALLAASGCVTGYTLVTTGVNAVDTLYVDAGSGWNKAPYNAYGGDRKNSQKWTQDGLMLNQLVFVPEVADGEALITSRQKDAALPLFRKDMLPNELEELAQSTFVKMFGEGNAVVETMNLRPHRFGEDRGVMFDVEATVTDNPKLKGTVGAFVANEKLYFMYYLGATPYYYEKYAEQADAIIRSATLTPPVPPEAPVEG